MENSLTRILVKALFLISSLIFLASCNKEELPSDYILSQQEKNLSSDPYSSKDSIPISRYSRFVVIDATTYITTTSGKLYKFKHFKDREESNVDINTSPFEIDVIIKNKTSYRFTPPTGSTYGGLILNDDETKHYLVGYNSIPSVFTIIKDEKFNTDMGGSARPFVGYVQSLKNRTIVLKTSDRTANINGEDSKYYTKLILKERL